MKRPYYRFSYAFGEVSPRFREAFDLVVERAKRSNDRDSLLFTKYSLEKIVRPAIGGDKSLSFFIASLCENDPKVLEKVYFYDNGEDRPRKLDPERVSSSLRDEFFYSPVTGELDSNYKKNIKIYYKLSKEVLDDL